MFILKPYHYWWLQTHWMAQYFPCLTGYMALGGRAGGNGQQWVACLHGHGVGVLKAGAGYFPPHILGASVPVKMLLFFSIILLSPTSHLYQSGLNLAALIGTYSHRGLNKLVYFLPLTGIQGR